MRNLPDIVTIQEISQFGQFLNFCNNIIASLPILYGSCNGHCESSLLTYVANMKTLRTLID